MPPGPGYVAYLLRLWRVPDGRWRASLDDPRTGERLVFGSLMHLRQHLDRLTAVDDDETQPTGCDPADAPE